MELEEYHDHTLDRPNFSYHPSSPRRPHCLSSVGVVPPIQIPAPINQYLRPYQREGVQFLYDHFNCARGDVMGNGALLCDDMGLGKTIQVIAFLCAILEKSCTKSDVILTGPKPTIGKGTFLIITPGSVLYNWCSEIEIWSHLTYGVYHRAKKDEILDKAQRGRLDVVLTTHDTAKNNFDELNSISWLGIIVDEVHSIKNTESQVAEALNKFKVKRRFGLTGTALQNNFTELWSLLNWANPGCLGNMKEFQMKFERPILEGQKFDCTKRELATARSKQKILENLMSLWVLRRTKTLLSSQLPKKDEFMVFCPATDLQASIYSSILDSDEIQDLVKSQDPCVCHSGKKRIECCQLHQKHELVQIRNEFLPLLLKCSNHIGLLLPSFVASDEQNIKAYRVCETAFAKHPEYLKMSRDASFLTLSDPKYCGKMQVLEKLLTKFKQEGSKVIVFSDSVRLLNIIEHYLVRKGYTYNRLDGTTKIEDRNGVVSSFNKDPGQFIFLISKKCGGTGLNVTGANRVIIFDPSWNPATDTQAEDRAFRIGQCRDVKVYRFITEGTVEEIIYLRQVYKQQLANMTFDGSKEKRYFTAVAGDSTQQGELFGVKNLFQPLRKETSLTIDILKRVDMIEFGVKIAADKLQGSYNSPTVVENADQLFPGAKTVVHSGRKAVVGNSRVEEHISDQALLELGECSQQPANYVDQRLEDFSDESDDINFNESCSHKVDKGGTKQTENDSEDDMEAFKNFKKQHLVAETMKSSPTSEDDSEKKYSKFANIAKYFGYSSSKEFAEYIAQGTNTERQSLLDRYYSSEYSVDEYLAIKQMSRTNITEKNKGKNSIRGEITSMGTENQSKTRQTIKRSKSNTKSSKPKRRCGFKSLEFVEDTSSVPIQKSIEHIQNINAEGTSLTVVSVSNDCPALVNAIVTKYGTPTYICTPDNLSKESTSSSKLVINDLFELDDSPSISKSEEPLADYNYLQHSNNTVTISCHSGDEYFTMENCCDIFDHLFEL